MSTYQTTTYCVTSLLCYDEFTFTCVLKNNIRYNGTCHFYFNLVVRLWNAIPSHCLDLTLTYSTIKRWAYVHFWDHFY